MKQNLTEIVFIIDKSGSMNGFEKDTIGGFNSFINEQKKLVGDANVTVVLFNHDYNVLFENESLQKVRELDDEDYFVSGTTALIDAMCKAIDSVGNRLSKLSEEKRPGKVIFVTITDGQENSSRNYSTEQLKEKIKHQEDKYSWKFVFLSSDLNQFYTAKSNWKIADAFSYDTNKTRDLYGAINSCVTSYRNSGNLDNTKFNDSAKK
jgi:uncharacterized protein YegL